MNVLDRIRKIPIDFDETNSLKKHNSMNYVKDAFLQNPIASVNDCTGFVQNGLCDDYEFDNLKSITEGEILPSEDTNSQ